jgi:hypothetical protein
MPEPVPAGERRVAKIYCPDCGWMKTIRAGGPADHEHAPTLSCAQYLAEGDVARHVAEREYSDGETHTPLVFTADGVARYEPNESAFIR